MCPLSENIASLAKQSFTLIDVGRGSPTIFIEWKFAGMSLPTHLSFASILFTIFIAQLEEVLNWLSLSDQLIKEIKEESSTLLEQRLIENKKLLHHKKLELEELETNLHSVESKFINNQMAHDTYHRWHGEFTEKIRLKRTETDKLSKDQNEVYFLLQNELHKFSDLKYIYCSSTSLQKQERLRTVFDSRLYYQMTSIEPPTLWKYPIITSSF